MKPPPPAPRHPAAMYALRVLEQEQHAKRRELYHLIEEAAAADEKVLGPWEPIKGARLVGNSHTAVMGRKSANTQFSLFYVRLAATPQEQTWVLLDKTASVITFGPADTFHLSSAHKHVTAELLATADAVLVAQGCYLFDDPEEAAAWRMLSETPRSIPHAF